MEVYNEWKFVTTAAKLIGGTLNKTLQTEIPLTPKHATRYEEPYMNSTITRSK